MRGEGGKYEIFKEQHSALATIDYAYLKVARPHMYQQNILIDMVNIKTLIFDLFNKLIVERR